MGHNRTRWFGSPYPSLPRVGPRFPLHEYPAIARGDAAPTEPEFPLCRPSNITGEFRSYLWESEIHP